MLIENQLKKLGFGTAAVFLLVVASLLGASQMYLLAVIVALVPVAGWLISWLSLKGLVCSRTAPATADEHGRMLVTVTVRNLGSLPKFFLRLSDVLPRYLRYAGTPSGESGFIAHLWPGQSRRVLYYAEPQRRGVHKIGPLSIIATDLFGFRELRRTVAGSAEVLVYPEILPVTSELLSGGAASGWRDDANARRRGDGIDFAGVREYRDGDALRRVNWKTTARTGALAVTEFTQGFATDIVIVLDREATAYENSGHGPVSSFEYGVKIATSLGAAALEQGSVVHVLSMGDEEDFVAPLHDYSAISRMLERMARIEPDGSVDIAWQMSNAWKEIKTTSIVVVITPRAPDDPLVRSETENLFQNPVVSSVDIYWLDNKSFQAVAESARAGRTGAAPSSEPAAKVRTELGREFSVNASTNLIALLGGSAID